MALTKIPANLLDKSAHVDFADNERLRLGTGNDLQIYHNATNSYIDDAGTGALNIRSSGLYLEKANGAEVMASFIADGAATLYHDGSIKLATSSAGATVTGTLTVTGDLDITGNVNSTSVTDLDVTDKTITLGVGQTEAQSGGSGIIIDGSNASMLWDETNGEFDFNNPLSIVNSVADDTVLNLTANYSANGNAALLGFARVGGAVSGDIRYVDSDTSMEIGTNTAHSFAIKTGTTRRFSINSSGNVGIGTLLPTSTLHVTSTTANTNGMVRLQNNMDNNYETLRIESLGDYDAHIGFFADGSSNYFWGAGIDYSDSGKFKIANDNLLATNTRLTITTGGNVGIGYLAENPPDTLMVKNTTGSQKILMHAASETANRGVALGMTVTGTGGAAAIYGTDKSLSSVTENLIFNPDGGPILMGAVPQSASPAHVTIDGRGDADTFRLSYDYGHPTVASRGANLDFRLGNASGSATKITTNYWPGGSGNIDISAYNLTNQILLHTNGTVYFDRGTIKIGAYSYIGEDLTDQDSLHLMSDYTENIIFGQRDRSNNTWTESFRIDRYGNMNAPGTIIQTVRADLNNVVGTGDFDIISVNITPKFANSDMIIHFYTQWSIQSTFDGEDWGMKLLRDGTTIQGDTVNGYFISGGGVDASDAPLAATSYSAPNYYVRFASKTDIDTSRSSSTAQMTYKIRKVVAAGTSTKTVRFGVDGWSGATVEANRSRIVLMVQEVMPN